MNYKDISRFFIRSYSNSTSRSNLSILISSFNSVLMRNTMSTTTRIPMFKDHSSNNNNKESHKGSLIRPYVLIENGLYLINKILYDFNQVILHNLSILSFLNNIIKNNS